MCRANQELSILSCIRLSSWGDRTKLQFQATRSFAHRLSSVRPSFPDIVELVSPFLQVCLSRPISPTGRYLAAQYQLLTQEYREMRIAFRRSSGCKDSVIDRRKQLRPQ